MYILYNIFCNHSTLFNPLKYFFIQIIAFKFPFAFAIQLQGIQTKTLLLRASLLLPFVVVCFGVVVAVVGVLLLLMVIASQVDCGRQVACV